MKRAKLILHTICLISALALPITVQADPPTKLPIEEVKAFTAKHSAWALKDQRLTALFTFKGGFKAAVRFVQALVAPADQMNHHPDLTIIYNRVTVSLTTHDAGGITAADLKLATQVQAIYAGMSRGD